MDQWPPPTTVFRTGAPTLGIPIFEAGPREPVLGGPHPLDARFLAIEARLSDLLVQVEALQARIAQLEQAWPVRLAAWWQRLWRRSDGQ